MPEVVFSSRGAGKLIADQEKLNASVAKGTENYRLTAREAQQYERIATQISRRNETAQERFNRKLDEARKALAGNKDETILLARETARLQQEYDDATEAQRKHGETAKKSLTGSALTDIANYAVQFGAITTVIGTAKAALQELAAERERFAADSKSAILGEGSLVQLASSDAEYKALLKESRALSDRTGLTRDEAAGVLFSTKSLSQN